MGLERFEQYTPHLPQTTRVANSLLRATIPRARKPLLRDTARSAERAALAVIPEPGVAGARRVMWGCTQTARRPA